MKRGNPKKNFDKKLKEVQEFLVFFDKASTHIKSIANKLDQYLDREERRQKSFSDFQFKEVAKYVSRNITTSNLVKKLKEEKHEQAEQIIDQIAKEFFQKDEYVKKRMDEIITKQKNFTLAFCSQRGR